MKQLRAVRALALPDWWHCRRIRAQSCLGPSARIAPPRPPADIDVLYFDAADLSKEREIEHEKRLDVLLPGLPWQCA